MNSEETTPAINKKTWFALAIAIIISIACAKIVEHPKTALWSSAIAVAAVALCLNLQRIFGRLQDETVRKMPFTITFLVVAASVIYPLYEGIAGYLDEYNYVDCRNLSKEDCGLALLEAPEGREGDGCLALFAAVGGFIACMALYETVGKKVYAWPSQARRRWFWRIAISDLLWIGWYFWLRRALPGMFPDGSWDALAGSVSSVFGPGAALGVAVLLVVGILGGLVLENSQR